MELHIVPIDKPDDTNVIVGQAHFIKTVEDVHEALVGVSPSLRFGLAFCEASGPCLVRRSGNDDALVELATTNALAVGAGHSFVVFLGDGYPVNVLNQLKQVPEVCGIFCATANPVEIVIAETDLGRGIIGVIDGRMPTGTETDADVTDRKQLLRTIGYKLGPSSLTGRTQHDAAGAAPHRSCAIAAGSPHCSHREQSGDGRSPDSPGGTHLPATPNESTEHTHPRAVALAPDRHLLARPSSRWSNATAASASAAQNRPRRATARDGEWEERHHLEDALGAGVGARVSGHCAGVSDASHSGTMGRCARPVFARIRGHSSASSAPSIWRVRLHREGADGRLR